MTLRIVIGLGAAMTLCSMAHAEPIARFGQTIYPTLPKAAPAPIAVAPVATPLETRGRTRWSRRASRLRDVNATSPVERQPAPTPADTSQQARSAPAADGPHEGPAPDLRELVSRHARENGVPEDLAAAVVRIESRFNPRARGGGALGLMQIKYQTARSVGFTGNASGLMQPDTNLHYGMKVLADAYRASKGNVCMTLARYQSGARTTRMTAANRSYCTLARSYMAKL